MSDLVVTVPQGMWADWIREGDAARTPESGEEWGYSTAPRPPIHPGERLYVVAWGRLRGFAPVTRVEFVGGRWVIGRKGGAVPVTIAETLPGFRGWRYPHWRNTEEETFPDWQLAGLPMAMQASLLLDGLAGAISDENAVASFDDMVRECGKVTWRTLVITPRDRSISVVNLVSQLARLGLLPDKLTLPRAVDIRKILEGMTGRSGQ